MLRNAYFQTGDQVVALKPRGSSLVLPHSDVPACVRYHVDLPTTGKRTWRADSWRTQGAIVLDPSLWFWYPDGTHRAQHWRIEFKLPPGYDVSAPWHRLGRHRNTVLYEWRDRRPESDARMAIGRFRVESIKLPGGRLRYALLPARPAPDSAALRRWITSGARALLSAYGHLPVPDVQVLVIPIGQGREPVPWGEVERGGGDALHLYIDQRRPAGEFMRDWVLVHEFSHLLLPILTPRDHWLSEGVASYYQNVLRARAGLRSVQTTWNELHAGFERGLQSTRRGRSLAEASAAMLQNHAFMRVYWSGAAIALLADVELRRRTAGTQSLDTALATIAACCLPSERHWHARELLQRLDQATGTRVFMNLYRKYINADTFPDLGTTYTALGLHPVSARKLRLDTTAPDAAICKAIMTAPKH